MAVLSLTSGALWQLIACLGRRCQMCSTVVLTMANQQLWSVHPVNPFDAAAPFHANMRKPALQRVREAWQLFTDRRV